MSVTLYSKWMLRGIVLQLLSPWPWVYKAPSLLDLALFYVSPLQDIFGPWQFELL